MHKSNRSPKMKVFTFLFFITALFGVPPAVYAHTASPTQDPETVTSKTFTRANKVYSGTHGETVNTFTGELFDSFSPDINLGGPMPLFFDRYYASGLNSGPGSMGDKWRHRFEWFLTSFDEGATIVIFNHQDRFIQFEPNGEAWDLIGKTDIAFRLVESGTDFILGDPRTGMMYTFDSFGTLIKIEDGKGTTHTLTYDGNGKLTQVSDGLGRILTFGYNGAGQLTSVMDPTRTVMFGYTGDDLTSSTDSVGNVTTYTNDTGGLMTAMTRPKGNTPSSQTYDSEGRVDTQTDANNNTVAFTYNPPTTITDPDGNTLVHAHTNTGELTSVTNEDGGIVRFGSDTTGRRNAITDRLGDVTTLTYHVLSGKPASVANTDGTVIRLDYTARDLNGLTFYDLTTITYPDATTEGFVWDAAGNLISQTDQAGSVWSFTYNANGQKLTATNPAGGVTTWTYHADRTLASTTDASGNTTDYKYDGLKRPITMIHPDATSLTLPMMTTTTSLPGRTRGGTRLRLPTTRTTTGSGGPMPWAPPPASAMTVWTESQTSSMAWAIARLVLMMSSDGSRP